MTPIALRLKEARDHAGLSQEELAAAVGTRQATISRLETGRSRRIEFDLLERIAKVLGVPAASLFVETPAKRRR